MLVNNNNVSFAATGILKFDDGLKGDSKQLGMKEHPHRSALVDVIQKAFCSTKTALKPLASDEVVFNVKEQGVTITMEDDKSSKKMVKNWSLWQFVSDPVQCLKDTAEALKTMEKPRFKRRID